MLSIIVPVHNELLFTSWCLASILNRTSAPFELIIVNDQSDDKTTNFLKEFVTTNKDRNIKYIETEKQSWHSLSSNIGIDNSIGDYICLLNSDTLVTTNWDTKLINFLNSEEGKKCCACGPSSSYAASPQTIPQLNKTRYAIKYNESEQVAKDIEEKYKNQIVRAKITGYCFTFTRKVLEQVGKLDHEVFPSAGNETDWCLRAIVHHDLYPYIIRDAYVHHFGGSSYTKTLSQEGKNRAWQEADIYLIERWGKQTLDVVEKKLWKNINLIY